MTVTLTIILIASLAPLAVLGLWPLMARREHPPVVAVEAGEPICTLYVNDDTALGDAIETMKRAVTIGEKPEVVLPMVYDAIR